MYIYIYVYTNLPVNVIVRLPHPRSGDSQGQETFLAPSADKQTRNYDTECSNHHPSLSTLRPKGFSRSKMKWWAADKQTIYVYIYIYVSIHIYIYTHIYILYHYIISYHIKSYTTGIWGIFGIYFGKPSIYRERKRERNIEK